MPPSIPNTKRGDIAGQAHQRLPVEHPGSAAKAALNDCPHERKAKGAHLAAFVSCIPLFDSTVLWATVDPIVRTLGRTLIISKPPSNDTAKRRPQHVAGQQQARRDGDDEGAFSLGENRAAPETYRNDYQVGHCGAD